MDATLESAKILPCQKVLVEEKVSCHTDSTIISLILKNCMLDLVFVLTLLQVDGKFPEAEQVGTSMGPYSPVSVSGSISNGSSSLRLGYLQVIPHI